MVAERSDRHSSTRSSASSASPRKNSSASVRGRAHGRSAVPPRTWRIPARPGPLWSAPRIHGERQKLGVEISQATVSRYLVRHRRPLPRPLPVAVERDHLAPRPARRRSVAAARPAERDHRTGLHPPGAAEDAPRRPGAPQRERDQRRAEIHGARGEQQVLHRGEDRTVVRGGRHRREPESELAQAGHDDSGASGQYLVELLRHLGVGLVAETIVRRDIYREAACPTDPIGERDAKGLVHVAASDQNAANPVMKTARRRRLPGGR